MSTNFITELKNQFTNKDSIDAILMTVTRVATAAAFKNKVITKQSATTVTLHKDSVYREQVIESALHNDANKDKNVNEILQFTPEKSIYNHDPDHYCIMYHGKTELPYLYATLVSSCSVYYIDGVEVPKEDVLPYLTPSVQKSWTEPKEHKNVNADLVHDVKPLTYKLSSVQSLHVIENNVVIKNTDFQIA